MNETLLLFHAPSRPELLKIQRALLPLHIRLRCISQKDYLQPLGFLAGMKKFSRSRYNNRFNLPGTGIKLQVHNTAQLLSCTDINYFFFPHFTKSHRSLPVPESYNYFIPASDRS